MAIRLMFLLRRAPHLTREEFSRHWLNEHAVLAVQADSERRVRRYCQLHAMDHPTQRAIEADRQTLPADFDGIAEVTFDSIEQMTGGGRVDAFDAVLKEDEKRFIDMSRSMVMIVDEHEINLTTGQPLSQQGHAAPISKGHFARPFRHTGEDGC